MRGMFRTSQNRGRGQGCATAQVGVLQRQHQPLPPPQQQQQQVTLGSRKPWRWCVTKGIPLLLLGQARVRGPLPVTQQPRSCPCSGPLWVLMQNLRTKQTAGGFVQAGAGRAVLNLFGSQGPTWALTHSTL